MDCRNLVEPGALVAHFQAHPPEGFAPVAGLAAPAFEAPFDLLTTADDAFKARLRRLPLYQHWSRWLRVRTGFVGTTVTEYAPLPGAAAAPAASDPPGTQRSAAGFAREVRRVLGGRFRLAIVKDIPQDSPLLSDADNAYARALAQACADEGFLLVEGQALAYVPIDFASIDAYLARLSPSRRQNLRRKLRSRAEVAVQVLPTGSPALDDGRIAAYYALYEGVYAQSEVHFDRLTPAFFSALLRDAEAGGVVFEYRRRSTGALLGWNLCYRHQGRLVDKYIGLAYPDARALNLYFVSWVENLEYALREGLTHYVAGWTDPEVKRSLGARFTFTRHAVYVRQPVLRALARRLVRHFESDRQWHEAT
ncbi:GNAT family N-acetyltransferase [Pseudorhodoferax sp. Leaf274]|uniref:GNAT family N-acetyltransferase n=1 Tax=Pseudorhodoferax sp. Leaf274 TaxID=1736318 RepID=UPI0007027C10|nr:GNAT family N-acetyltransferase [Pseudorhodoferax sp. Leaf274]KQP48560.1 ATP synthase subunit alpha [Pseudorhodoferax sp. Leaf274]